MSTSNKATYADHYQQSLNRTLSFNQIVDLVRQLSPLEKTKLQKVLQSEEIGDEFDIPEAHKNIVRKRTQASQTDPSRILSWDEAKKKTLEIKFEVKPESPYDPEFVKKIEESRKQASAGQTVKIDLDDIWK